MGELGQLLCQTREEKGLDLDRVANETRIRVQFLEALEQENYDELPTPGHVHGFLRNYALYLGLDLNEVQALYEAENQENRFVPGIFRPKDIDLMPRRPLIRASVVLGIVLFLVVLVVGGWAFWRYGLPAVEPLLRLLTPAAERTTVASEQTAAAGQTAAAEQTATTEATAAAATQKTATAAALAAVTKTPTEAAATPTAVEATPMPTALPTDTPLPTPTLDRPLSSPTPTPEPTATPTRTPVPTSTPVGGVTLSIVVVERAWLQVTVDGQELPGELLEVGDERTWEAEETIFFICGNAGGIEVTVNGEELGALGGRAEVVDRTWTPLGEATPTPAPS
jgi:cytoskeleton protein RodZ